MRVCAPGVAMLGAVRQGPVSGTAGPFILTPAECRELPAFTAETTEPVRALPGLCVHREAETATASLLWMDVKKEESF